jgi:hypothetical protein
MVEPLEMKIEEGKKYLFITWMIHKGDGSRFNQLELTWVQLGNEIVIILKNILAQAHKTMTTLIFVKIRAIMDPIEKI